MWREIKILPFSIPQGIFAMKNVNIELNSLGKFSYGDSVFVNRRLCFLLPSLPFYAANKAHDTTFDRAEH